MIVRSGRRRWSGRRGGGGLALLLLLLGGCRGDAPPPEAAVEALVLPPDPTVLRLAGSGTMVPLARALGAAFRAAHPGAPRVVVEDSIGSGGGIRAAVDGAVDVGMVSRPLSSREAGWPLLVLPIGRDAVVLAKNPDVAVTGLTSAEVVAMYEGQKRAFADGTPVAVLLRDRGESANLALDAAIPGMAQARERALALGFRVLYHDDAMAAALAVTPGAIGVFSLGLQRASRIPIKVLDLDGRTPSAASVRDGSWPLVRPLCLVIRADRLEHTRRFLEFVVSAPSRQVITDVGYLPLDGEAAAAAARGPRPAVEFTAGARP